MARTKKKRPYVRKEDKLAAAERKIESLQQARINDAEEYDTAIEKMDEVHASTIQERDQFKAALDRQELEIRAANSIAESAMQQLADIKESILQHQRTLELVTQTAHNNAQMGRDLLSSLTAKQLVRTDNVVGMRNEAKSADTVVNVDGHGRRVG